MKKKILYIILCFISVFICSGVSAEEKTCKTDGVHATLKIRNSFYLPIPSLGRVTENNKSYIYKMNLGNYEALCLDSGLPANTGLTYHITHEVNDKTWKKAYQFALDSKNEFEYAIAQAQMWLLSGRNPVTQLSSSFYIKDNPLYNIAIDIYINSNCESLIGKEKCDSLNGDANTTNSIITEYITQEQGNYQKIEQVKNSIKTAYNRFINSTKIYENKLYYWVADLPNRQAMVAGYDCDDNKNEYCVDSSNVKHYYNEDKTYKNCINSEKDIDVCKADFITKYCPNNNSYCTDKNGTKFYYKDSSEYNSCINKGTSEVVCKSDFMTKYCSNSNDKYVVLTSGTSAVCSNNKSNIGVYYEYVESSTDGTAIPGKGDNEKQLNNYCNLYCLENYAEQIFPGNVRPSVSVGTYIIWPTSESTLSSVYKNKYPLSFTGQKTCYVVMAGEDNPVNKTDIDAAYNSYINNVNNKNKYDNTFAKKYYETSRINGGCESVYSNTNGVCKKSYDEMNNAKKTLDDYANSNEYRNAVQEQIEVNNYNGSHNFCEHDYCSEVTYYCTDSATNIASISCPIITKQCNQQKESGCVVGNPKTLSQASQNALNRYNNLNNIYSSKKAVYESCQAQKNACNDYTNSVNSLIDFSNQIRYCATYTPNCSGTSCDIYNYKTNVNLSWGDPEYGTTITDSTLEKSINYYSISDFAYNLTSVSSSQSIKNIKNNIKNLISDVIRETNTRKITTNVNVTYSLPTSPDNLLYNYVVKRNDSFKAQTLKPSSDSNFTTIGFSNLPISYNAKAGISYYLKLSNISFGENGQFTPNEYVCNYNVTKNLQPDCLCPPETNYSGKDLTNIMIDQNLTCSEAQEKYCNKNNPSCPDGTKVSEMTTCMESLDYFTCYDKYCRDGNNKNKYCPEPYSSINISACLNNYDYNYCVNLLCKDGNKEYKCKNKNGVDGEMDITSCVYTKMSQGLSESEAIDLCDKLVCPLSGLRIIYRTISLENPFPSKTADAKVTQKGLSIGMFNDEVLGRYPGANWNNVKLVKNHILNVTRNGEKIDGSEIYGKEPLYKFILNSETITAIRNYNQNQNQNGGYADFTLECRLNNSKACVSEKFVHNTQLSGLVSGLCMNSTSKNNFYKCSGD